MTMDVVPPAAAVAAPTDGLAPPPAPKTEKQMPTVLCCMCSLPIPPNPTSMCVLCIRTRVDITEGIATNLTIHQCRGCQRYLRPPWVEAKLESRELMAVCLRKVSFPWLRSVQVVCGVLARFWSSSFICRVGRAAMQHDLFLLTGASLSECVVQSRGRVLYMLAFVNNPPVSLPQSN